MRRFSIPPPIQVSTVAHLVSSLKFSSVRHSYTSPKRGTELWHNASRPCPTSHPWGCGSLFLRFEVLLYLIRIFLAQLPTRQHAHYRLYVDSLDCLTRFLIKTPDVDAGCKSSLDTNSRFHISSSSDAFKVLRSNQFFRWHEISGHPVDRPWSLWADAVDPSHLHRLVSMREEISQGRRDGNLQFKYENGTWVQLEVRPFRCRMGSQGADRGAARQFRRVTEFGPEVSYIGKFSSSKYACWSC